MFGWEKVYLFSLLRVFFFVIFRKRLRLVWKHVGGGGRGSGCMWSGEKKNLGKEEGGGSNMRD